jgi:hypothetical protein
MGIGIIGVLSARRKDERPFYSQLSFPLNKGLGWQTLFRLSSAQALHGSTIAGVCFRLARMYPVIGLFLLAGNTRMNYFIVSVMLYRSHYGRMSHTGRLNEKEVSHAQ